MPCAVKNRACSTPAWSATCAQCCARRSKSRPVSQRLSALGLAPEFGSKNPFPFMDLQDVQELTNFFERRVSAYQVGISGAVGFDDAF